MPTRTDQLVIAPEDASEAPPWTIESWMNSDRDLQLSDLAGRVVVLHAFQMLCPGCVVHGIPQAQRIHAAFDPKDVAVIGLHSVFEHHEAMRPVSLRAFLHEYRVGFPVAIDAHDTGPQPVTMRAYEMRGTPTLILIDRIGRVRMHAFGRPEDLLVGAAVASLVAETEGTIRIDTGGQSRENEAGCNDEGCSIEGP